MNIKIKCQRIKNTTQNTFKQNNKTDKIPTGLKANESNAFLDGF